MTTTQKPLPINESALRRERRDPDEEANPVHPVAAFFFVAMAAWGAWYFAAYSGDSFAVGGDTRTAPIIEDKPSVDGKALFATACASCHQATGQGIPGAFPPLAGSPWVIDDDSTMVRILLKGLTGPIDVKGSTYNGVMPSFGTWSDAEIAAVVSHVRGTFGNTAAPVDAAHVAALRAAHANQTTPWAGGEALTTVRAAP